MKKAVLIDGNSIMNRAFYGTQSSNMRNADGQFTGALFGFLNILLKNLDDIKPDYAAVAFDMKAPTFRHKMFSEYKGTRHPMPEELAQQMPVVKELLDAMRIDRVELEGFEADDLLGTMAKQAESQGVMAYILTGDRDSFQLISDKVNIRYFSSRGGKSETINYDSDKVFEDYGVPPLSLIDVKALMGDTSDNVPGVPGVGEKTAVELIKTYGSVEKVYENIENITKKALNAHLTEGRESAALSKILVTIDTKVEMDDVTVHVMREPDNDKFIALLRKLEFRSFIKRFEKETGKSDVSKTADEITKHDAEELKVSVIKADPDNVQESVSVFGEIRKIAEEKGMIAISYETENDVPVKVCLASSEEKMYEVHFKKDSGAKKEASGEQLSLFGIPSADNVSSLEETKTEALRKEFVSCLRKIFENEKIGKIFFDSKPFVKWLLDMNCGLKGLVHDVKIAAYLSDSLRRTDYLPDAYRYYTGENMPENSPFESIYMLKMKDFIEKRLESEGMLYLYNFVELPLVNVLAEMEKEGFKVRPDILEEEGRKFGARIKETEQEIYSLAGCEFNINSPKQLGEVLFEKLELAKGKKSKTGYKTGAEVLEELADKHPIVPLILEYRQNKKLMSTYIDGLLQVIDKKSGKIHSTFNQTITATGRLSSTEPNLQNIPVRHELGKRIRTAFVPSAEGRVLVDADYSQIELRIMAHLSADSNMTETFRTGGDIHTMTAAKVNGIEPEDVTPEMRTKAKAVNFGIIYGISDFGLAKDLGVGFYEARGYIDDYFRMYPGVKSYLDYSVEFAKKNGYAVTVMGRRRYLPELRSSKFTERQFGERVAMNMPIQGTAADIIKFAMVRVHERLKKEVPGAKLVLQVHDELLLDVDQKDEERVKCILRDCMENVMTLSVPLPVSVSSGTDWGIK